MKKFANVTNPCAREAVGADPTWLSLARYTHNDSTHIVVTSFQHCVHA